MCGGFSESKPADQHAQELLNHHRNKINEHLGTTAEALEVTTYTTQVVAGTNYCIKFKLNGTDYCARIFVPLPCNGGDSELTSVKSCEQENCCKCD